jgi:hypothetical protein
MIGLLWVALSAAPPALATRVALTSTTCPLDGTAVRVYEKLTTDTHGGWDSDLAKYSSQGQWRAYTLSTCPTDLLTLHGPEFDAISPGELAQARSALAPWQARYSNPEAIPMWERYEIAADVYRALKRTPNELGHLYLQASWTARDAAVDVYIGLKGPGDARELLDAGVDELAKDLDPTTRKIVLHNLARVAHRGGFMTERDTHLRAFESVGDLTPRERQVLDNFRRMATEIEPRLQDLAIREFELALDGPRLDEVARLRTTFVLADLHRRRGRTDEAAAGYAFVVASSATPDPIRELAAWLGAYLAMD